MRHDEEIILVVDGKESYGEVILQHVAKRPNGGENGSV
jgi:hypothetical protein